jgi:MSHA biogenesis protein MshL
VGTDEFFVTNVSTTTTTGTTSTTTPSVTLQPFFSGISLDVTPQIDENNNIILHIHPSVSDVTTKTKTVKLGTSGELDLPLASSTISETDSIVRAQDGQIVAIGGLMKRSFTSDRNQVPGLGDVPVVGSLFSNSNRSAIKQELVILLKPTVVTGSDTWTKDIIESQRNFQSLEQPAGSRAQ